MAAPKLDDRAKRLIVEWIVGGYHNKEIHSRMKEHCLPEITDQALTNYRNRKDVKKAVEAAMEAAVQFGIANRSVRVMALNDRWRRMQDVIEQRSEDEEMQEVAGGDTGLLVKQLKGIGKGDDFQIVEEFGFDAGLLRELRAHEEQAAKELGQWTEKRDVTTGGKAIIPLDLSELPDDELDRRIAAAERGETPEDIQEQP